MMLKQAPFQPFGHAASGGGNATVPLDAPIQPPQAFVDVMANFLPRLFLYSDCDISGPTITTLTIGNAGDGGFRDLFVTADKTAAGGIAATVLDNHLSTAQVDSVLNYLSTNVGSFNSTPELDIYFSNASPTGGGANAPSWNLVNNGWHVIINVGAASASLHGSFGNDFTTCALSAAQVNAILAFLVANYLNAAWPLDLSGNDAAPTGQGIVDKATLITNGWTVTTN